MTCSPVSLKIEPRVDRAEHRAAVARALAQPVDVARAATRSSSPEKYGSSTRPGALADQRLVARPRAARRSARRCGGPARRARGAAARRSPGPRRTTVSRWLVMPTAVELARRRRRRRRAPRPRPRCVTSQISAASCSTQPGCGKCCVELAVGAADQLAPRRRRRGRSCRSCPGRSRASSARGQRTAAHARRRGRRRRRRPGSGAGGPGRAPVPCWGCPTPCTGFPSGSARSASAPHDWVRAVGTRPHAPVRTPASVSQEETVRPLSGAIRSTRGG